MEEREQNTRRASVRRLAATLFGDERSTSEADANQDAGCPRFREDENQIPTDVKTDQLTDSAGGAARPPVLIQKRDELPQEPDDSGSKLPQVDSASSSTGPYGADEREYARLRHLLVSGVVTTSVLARMETELRLKIAELRGKRADGEAKIEAMERDLRERLTEAEGLLN